MKLDLPMLLARNGVSCIDLVTGDPAVASFVLADACRDLRTEGQDVASVRLGDLVCQKESGGVIIPAGRDGALGVIVNGRTIPFTGVHMLEAGQVLTRHVPSHPLLRQISEALNLIAMDPEGARFPQEVRGQAFYALCVGLQEAPKFPVPFSAFARFVELGKIVSMVESASLNCPEIIAPSLHQTLLNAGFTPMPSAMISGVNCTPSMFQSVAQQQPDLSELLGTLTLAPLDGLETAIVTTSDHASRAAKLKGNSFAWWMHIKHHFQKALDNPNLVVSFMTAGRKDCLFFADEQMKEAGIMACYGWPSGHRRIVARLDGSLMFLLSEHDMPSTTDIKKITAALKASGPAQEFTKIDLMEA